MKCNQSRLGFKLVSPCPFPTTITTTPRAPPLYTNALRKGIVLSLLLRLCVNSMPNSFFLALIRKQVNEKKNPEFWVECSPMVRETWVQSQVMSYEKTLKMVLDTSLLNTQWYKVRIKVKGSNPGKGVAPSPTPWCSSYWKGSLLVALDYGHQLNFLRLKIDLASYPVRNGGVG